VSQQRFFYWREALARIDPPNREKPTQFVELAVADRRVGVEVRFPSGHVVVVQPGSGVALGDLLRLVEWLAC